MPTPTRRCLVGDGTAVFAAIHSPGDSPAFVDVQGSLIYEAGSLLSLELAGTTEGTYDRLTVAGDVTLAGALAVTLIDGFVLSEQDAFLVMDVAGQVHGRFTNAAEGDAVFVQYSGDPSDAPPPQLFITYTAGDGNDILLYTNPFGPPPPLLQSAVPEPSTLALITAALLLSHRRPRRR